MVAGRLRHVDMNYNLAVFEGDLQRAIIKVTEEEESIWVPRSKLKAHGYCVVIGSAWQLQEAGGIKKDREGVGLHTGEGQVTLSRHRFRKRDTDKGRY